MTDRQGWKEDCWEMGY